MFALPSSSSDQGPRQQQPPQPQQRASIQQSALAAMSKGESVPCPYTFGHNCPLFPAAFALQMSAQCGVPVSALPSTIVSSLQPPPKSATATTVAPASTFKTPSSYLGFDGGMQPSIDIGPLVTSLPSPPSTASSDSSVGGLVGAATSQNELNANALQASERVEAYVRDSAAFAPGPVLEPMSPVLRTARLPSLEAAEPSTSMMRMQAGADDDEYRPDYAADDDLRPAKRRAVDRESAEPQRGAASGGNSHNVTPFVSKLFFLLNSPEYSEGIRWSADGESFVFANMSPILIEGVSKLYRHANMASFVRQLNIYGFRRLNTSELLGTLSTLDSSLSALDFSGFTHERMHRDTPLAELSCIKPRVSGDPEERKAKRRARRAAAKRRKVEEGA